MVVGLEDMDVQSVEKIIDVVFGITAANRTSRVVKAHKPLYGGSFYIGRARLQRPGDNIGSKG